MTRDARGAREGCCQWRLLEPLPSSPWQGPARNCWPGWQRSVIRQCDSVMGWPELNMLSQALRRLCLEPRT